jgi:hypothetical protein
MNLVPTLLRGNEKTTFSGVLTPERGNEENNITNLHIIQCPIH